MCWQDSDASSLSDSDISDSEADEGTVCTCVYFLQCIYIYIYCLQPITKTMIIPVTNSSDISASDIHDFSACQVSMCVRDDAT